MIHIDFLGNVTTISKLALLLVTVATIGACTESNSEEEEKASGTRDGQHYDGAEDLATDLTDAFGSTISLEKPAERIVSFAPNLTEVLFYLNAQDRIVGRTDFCTYPPEVNTIPSIGTLNSYNYEKVLALKPDIVLMMTFDGTSKGEYDKLKNLGLTPFALDGQSITGVLNAIDTVGIILGQKHSTKQRTDSLRSIVDSIKQLASQRDPVQTFIVIDQSSLITVAGGFMNEVIRTAGGSNIAEGDPIPYPVYSREVLLHDDPEVILVTSATGEEQVLDGLVDMYPEWKELSAVKNKRVYAVPSDIIARPGPRIIEGLTYTFDLLHGSRN